MLLPSIPQFRKRRGQARSSSAAPPLPPAGLVITSVIRAPFDSWHLIVSFSAAIVWDPSSVPSAFRAFLSGTFQPPVDVFDVGTDWMELAFDASIALGAAWQVTGALTGITPQVAFPQAGTVV